VRHYLSLAKDVGGRIFGAQGANALARLAPEQANLEAGLHTAGPAALLGVAVTALNGIGRLWTATGAGSLASFQALADACGSAGEAWNEAECYYRLGETALARSEHDAARAAYEQALPLYRQVGSVLGEANCIQSLGDIARDPHDATAARQRYQESLVLFQRIAEPYSIGWTHHRLARLSEGAERAAHIAAARQAWASIDRPDLIATHLDPLA
jgi:tetratricopeptide (TPR) repeat protein